MQVINECIQSIKTLMDEIAQASAQQSEMIVSVENRIKEVSKVTEENSAAAEESAAISNELSNQAKTLNQQLSLQGPCNMLPDNPGRRPCRYTAGRDVSCSLKTY